MSDITVLQLTPDATTVTPDREVTTIVESGEIGPRGPAGTGGGVPAWVALTDAATIAVDAALGWEFSVTLGGNRTLGNPTNPTDGQRLLFRIAQPASGGPYTLAYDTKYRFGLDVASPTLSTDANKIDYVGAIYDAADDTWDVLAVARGY